jgi:hypothetical protein
MPTAFGLRVCAPEESLSGFVQRGLGRADEAAPGMQIPGADRAVIDDEKVRDYLVSVRHPVGKFKAVFFASLGYTAANWRHLRRDLRALALLDSASQRLSRYGITYEVSATLTGPSGRSAVVVSAWIVRHEEGIPRFVTAYPGER